MCIRDSSLMVAHDDSKQDFSQYIWTGTVHCVLEISTIAISTIASGWHTRCGGARLTLAPSHQGCEARVPRASLAPSHPRTTCCEGARVRGWASHTRTRGARQEFPGRAYFARGSFRISYGNSRPISHWFGKDSFKGFHMVIPHKFPIDVERLP